MTAAALSPRAGSGFAEQGTLCSVISASEHRSAYGSFGLPWSIFAIAGRSITFSQAPTTGSVVSYSISVAASLVGIFVFLETAYTWLTNAHVTWRDALPGALLAAVVLEASFQVLPIFVRHADVNVTLRAFGGPVLLLIWLYLMANVIVFGAELNWWLANDHEDATEPQTDEAAGLA